MNIKFIFLFIIITLIIILIIINTTNDVYNDNGKKIIYNETKKLVIETEKKSINTNIKPKLKLIKSFDITNSNMSLSLKLYTTNSGEKIFKKKTILKDDILILTLLKNNDNFVQLYGWNEKKVTQKMINKYNNINNYASINLNKYDVVYNIYTYYIEGISLHDFYNINSTNEIKKEIIQTLINSCFYLHDVFNMSNIDMHSNNIIISNNKPIIIDIMLTSDFFGEASILIYHIYKLLGFTSKINPILENKDAPDYFNLKQFYELFMSISAYDHDKFYNTFKPFFKKYDPIGYIRWEDIELFQENYPYNLNLKEHNNIFFQIWIREKLENWII